MTEITRARPVAANDNPPPPAGGAGAAAMTRAEMTTGEAAADALAEMEPSP